jgi:hypothetical protein
MKKMLKESLAAAGGFWGLMMLLGFAAFGNHDSAFAGFLCMGVIATATKIADVIIPDVWSPYVIQRATDLNMLIRMGIISSDSGLDALANGPNTVIDMPFWSDLTGVEETLQDDTDLTPGSIGSGQDKAVKLFRGRAFGTNDLAKYLAGDDPAAVIAGLVADYWNRREQAVLIALLTGVFADNAANDAGDMIVDNSIADGSQALPENLISGNAIIDAAQTMGDAKDKLTAIAMHSMVEARLAKNNLITYLRDSEGRITMRQFMGLNVIVDDGCPATSLGAGKGYKYRSYLFGAGAIARANATLPADEATEIQRNGLGGETYLITRRHFVLHPRGIAWQNVTVTPTKPASPSNANLALPANWSRVYDRKNIRLVALDTNG